MNWDVVLHWMTHLGGGSWTGFREAVANIAPTEDDLEQTCRGLRVHLSDLGHADFFVDGSQRWRTLPPVLAALPMSNAAFLSGGRTPQLMEDLKNAAALRRCEIAVTTHSMRSIDSVFMSGEMAAMKEVGGKLNVPFIVDFPSVVCSRFAPLPRLLASAPEEKAPTNWRQKFFDFESMSWMDGLRLRAACECSSRFGVRQYYVYARHGVLLRLPKREAVYASAMLRRIKLLNYDSSTGTLSVPIAAPLPELLARAASLCSGRPAPIDRAYIRYQHVPPATGAMIAVASGQPFPMIKTA